MARKHNRGAASIKALKAAAQASVAKVTDSFFAPGAHPRRGELADEQVAGDRDPRQKQSALDVVVAARKERAAAADPVGAHDDE